MEVYDGSREFDELYAFATSPNLKVSCSPKHLDECTEEQKTKLEEIMAMSIDDLKAALKTVEGTAQEMEAEFDDSTDVLEREYMEMQAESDSKKEKAMSESNYRFLKAVKTMRNKNAADGHDEL